MPWEALLIVGAAMLVAQFVKGVTGFGSALVAMPVLLSVLEPKQAILMMVATDVFGGAWLMRDVWARIRWTLVGCLFLGVLPGQWVGTELLDVLDATWVRRILGALVVLMGAAFTYRPVIEGMGELEDLPDQPGRLLAMGTVAGFFAGLSAGLVGAGGPPVIAYSKRFFENQFYRAQLVALLELSGLNLSLMLIAKGTDLGVLMNLPWVLVPVVVGNRIGAWLAPRVSKHHFGRATGLVLVGAGIALWM